MGYRAVNIISLGAGVQSTTMALMAAAGEITPMPNCAIFADTQWEPKAVYEHLDWLCGVLPFPVHRVTAGNLRSDILAHRHPTQENYRAVPWHIRNPDGSAGMGKRQCTKEYKLTPIRRKVRELLGGKTPKGGAQQWIGISLDEVMRIKPSDVGYMVNRWPLIEKRMDRNDCLRWIERNGYPTPPKSACIGCPFHRDAQWRALRDNPVEWQDAIEVDAAIRSQPKHRGKQYMHRSLVPLAEVDLRTLEDHGQLNLFNNECEGMCGV
jgi:hypothetical protein